MQIVEMIIRKQPEIVQNAISFSGSFALDQLNNPLILATNRCYTKIVAAIMRVANEEGMTSSSVGFDSFYGSERSDSHNQNLTNWLYGKWHASIHAS